jgi:hypothetical protein
MFDRVNKAQGTTNRRVVMDIKKRLSGWMALAVFATVGGAMVAADPAFAKVDVDKLTVSGEIRVRYEYRTQANFGTSQNSNESAGSHRVRIGVGYDLTPDVSFFAQVQDARVWGSETATAAAVAGAGIAVVSSANGNSTGVDLHQGYIQVKNVLVPGLGLKIGRQEIIYGDHRLFGNFGWSQVGNSFDAGKIMWTSEMVDVDLFWARIIESEIAAGCTAGTASCSGVIFPGAGTKATTDQDVYGAYTTIKLGKNNRWTIEPYYFLLKDSRAPGTTGLLTPQASSQARNILGTRANGRIGGLDLTLESDWQFGSISDNASAASPSDNLHINAHQHAARIGYTFEPVPMKPRIGFEFNYASGDDCVNKTGADSCVSRGSFNTADNLYPTNHFHYGYMDLMAWKNMVNYSVVFDVKPSAVSKLQINFILHRLARTTDNWYRASQGAYATSLASNQAASLGQELDIHYWHTFKEKFKFEVGYGHFFTGEYIEKSANQVATGASTGPASTASFTQTSDQNWGYVMASVLF